MSTELSIQDLEQRIHAAQTLLKQHLMTIETLEVFEKIRTQWLGKQGELATLTDLFKALPPEARKIVGPLFQSFKSSVTAQLEDVKQKLEDQKANAALAVDAGFDVTAYQPKQYHGSLHPLTILTNKIEDIFISMGYTLAHGPEVETEFYNFEALNIPSNHPARDMWDTLWLNHPGLLLRTHTSTVQIRTMKQQKPPLAIASIGRVYRHEATDATHDYMFNQIEGLLVDENIAFTHLLGTLKNFFQQLFGQTTLTIRVRPGYFPFVEPGIEVDISCPFCTEGCSICKYTQWIEMAGAGLVHPNVLSFTGIDPEKYSGFAFGMGLSRLAMLQYNIPDIRLLSSSSLDFLRQF